MLLERLLRSRLFSRSLSAQVIGALEDERKRRHTDIDLLRLYYARDANDASAPGVDDRSWQDLDFDEVFLKIDFAVSEPGRQVLYDMLRRPGATVEPLQELERAVVRCAADEALAEEIRVALAPLRDRRSAFLVNLIYGELPARPRFWWIFPLLTTAAVACAALSVVWPRALLVWVVVCAVNICAQLAYKPRVQRFIPAIHELPKFIAAARRLGRIAEPSLARDAAALSEGAAAIGSLGPVASWLKFEPAEKDGLVASLYEYVNLLFLFDVTAFVVTLETIRRKRDRMRGMFTSLGRLDAFQSIAKWRDALPVWTVPEFTAAQKSIDADDLAHPLLDDAVRNPLHIDARSVLISGSNMSGKTTFVRALGVNAVLAQTLHTVSASRWIAPFLHVRTFIGRSDSLIEGKSYYLAEAEAVLSLVRAKEQDAQHLFLVDEIFRGTNTTERIAAGFAVLSYLNRGNDIVVVATHDLEVLDLLGDAYEAQHFSEQIDSGGLSFDYRIRPGRSSTRNAIALLQFMNYPADVIAQAISTASSGQASGVSSSE